MLPVVVARALEREARRLRGLNRDEVGGKPVVEVGWSIAPARWGEGFAPEVAPARRRLGLRARGLERIVSFTLPENVRSRRVMEKIGMTYAREFERAGRRHVLYELQPDCPLDSGACSKRATRRRTSPSPTSTGSP